MLLILKKIQSTARGMINPLVLNLKKSASYNCKNTLVVLGHPRSGTTWLAELLATIPNSGIVFEPLNPKLNPDAKKFGFDDRNYCPPEQEWPEAEQYLRDVLCGRVLTSWTTSAMPMRRAFVPTNRWIVKFIGINSLLPWFLRHFSLPKPILIIRHPCAVLASMKSRGWKGFSLYVEADRQFLDMNPEFEDLFGKIDHPVDLYAARWCIDHWIPLTMNKPLPYHLISYEKLITSGAQHLQPVFDDWGIHMPEEIHNAFIKPSAKASNTYSTDKFDMLGKWQSLLSDDEIDRILSMTSKFGLDFYTRDPEPDYDRLYGSTPVIIKR